MNEDQSQLEIRLHGRSPILRHRATVDVSGLLQALVILSTEARAEISQRSTLGPGVRRSRSSFGLGSIEGRLLGFSMGNVSAECFGCAVNAGAIKPVGGTIYEDDYWIADHGIDRLVRGYVVLKPKRHVHELADLTAEEAASLGGVAKRLLAAMRAALGAERVYICPFAETVHHLHFHLLPRYPEMPALSDRMVPDLFAGKWSCSPAEAQNAAIAIRAALASN